MKQLIIVIVCVGLIFCISGCENNATNGLFQESLSTTQYSDATGKYYEETKNGYKAALYEKSEITVEKIQSWLASCETGEKYYQYIDSDPDSWDMFIFYPIDYKSFSFSVVDSTVKFYLTSNELSTNSKEGYTLIRVQAPSRGTWPNTSELYVDDSKIDRQDSE